jgi:hypothetical protein
MKIKVFDLFMGQSDHTPDSWEEASAISRREAKEQYEKTFRDELRREDAKLARLDYPTDVMDPRRRQEFADGGIIREDDRAFANLPAQAINHEYPSFGYYSNPYMSSIGKKRAYNDRQVGKVKGRK